MKDVISILLLGGQSRRMGQPKDELIWQGYALWEYLYHILAQVSGNCDHVYLSGVKSHPRAITDLMPGRGPLMGFYSVLKYLRDTKQISQKTQHLMLLVTPVDLPLIKVKDFEELLNGTFQACVWDQSPLPVVFRYSEQLFVVLEEIIQSENKPHSFQYLLKQLEVERKPLNIDLARRIQGTNTPREWEVACEFKNKFGSIEIPSHSR